MTYTKQQGPLHVAARKGIQVCAKKLIEAGASVGKVDAAGNTPLAYAARGGHVTIVRSLLAAGADANSSNMQGDTPLHLAAKRGSRECVGELLAAGADANARDARHQTALLLACRHSHWEVALVLLEQGVVADVNVQDAQTGRTALHWAARNGGAEVVARLLRVRAEMNARDRHWDTPFLAALRTRRLDVVALLLRSGCDVAATDRAHNTALHVAAGDGLTEVVPQLLRAGLNVNLKGAAGRTPLMLAAAGAHVHITKLLLARGAGVDLADRSHATALVHALLCPAGRDARASEVVKTLIRANCDVDQGVLLRRLLELSEHSLLSQRHIDDRQYTPLEIAYVTGQTALVAMLLRAGSDANRFRLARRSSVRYAEDFVSSRSDLVASHDSSLLLNIEIAKRRTRSLKELCRKQVLNAIGTNVTAKVVRLPVSYELMEFLQFAELDEVQAESGDTGNDDTASVSSNKSGDDVTPTRPTYKDRGNAWDDEPVHTAPAFQRTSWTRQTFAGRTSRGAKQVSRRQSHEDTDVLSRATAHAAYHTGSLPRTSGARTAWLISGRVASVANKKTTPVAQRASGRTTPTGESVNGLGSRQHLAVNSHVMPLDDRCASLPSTPRIKARSRVLNMADLCLGDPSTSPMMSPSPMMSSMLSPSPMMSPLPMISPSPTLSPSPVLSPSSLTSPSPAPSPVPSPALSTQSMSDATLYPVLQLIQATERQTNAVRRSPTKRSPKGSSMVSLANTEVVSANSLRSWERSLRSSFGSASSTDLANRNTKTTAASRLAGRMGSLRRPRNPAIVPDARKTSMHSSGTNLRKIPSSSKLSEPDLLDVQSCSVANRPRAHSIAHPVNDNERYAAPLLSSGFTNGPRAPNQNRPDVLKFSQQTPVSQTNGFPRRRYGNSVSSTDDECMSPTDSLPDPTPPSAFKAIVRPQAERKTSHDSLNNNRYVISPPLDNKHVTDYTRTRSDGENNNSFGNEERADSRLSGQASVNSSSSSINDSGHNRSRIPVPKKRFPTPVMLARGRNMFASPLQNGDVINGSPFSRTRSFRY